MKVYSYPRSGTHFVMRTLWLTFFQDQMADYRELFGSHFGPVEGESLGVVRHPFYVARSIWEMRDWFGLTKPQSFTEFLGQTYRESFVPFEKASTWTDFGQGPSLLMGEGDRCFAEVDYKPIDHIFLTGQHHRTGVCWIEYELLVTHPQGVLNQIARTFGLDPRPAKLPTRKVGYGI